LYSSTIGWGADPMNDLIDKIKQAHLVAMRAHANEVLSGQSSAAEKTEFGFGWAAGYYQGLKASYAILESLLREQDEKERNDVDPASP
jgi:hypothetical protein